jgi:hypothetical protein
MSYSTEQDLRINGLVLKQDLRLEYVVAQLQPSTQQILCVVDCYLLRWFHRKEDIPRGLMFEHKGKDVETISYSFRCQRTDSLYTFFLDSVSRFLCTREEEECVGRVVKISN